MKVDIITTKKDVSIIDLQNLITAEIIDYLDISVKGDRLLKKGEYFNPEFLLLRDPRFEDTSHNLEIFDWIINHMSQKVLLDVMCIKENPHFEDKKWQARALSSLKIPIPETVFHIMDIGRLTYPIIAKRRYSSRGTGNYVVSHPGKLFDVPGINNQDFIFQKFISFDSDYRVQILGEEIIWIARRVLQLHEYGRTGVTVVQKVNIQDLQSDIKEACLKIADRWSADFLGIDVIVKGSSFFVLEVNLFPQFKSNLGVDNNQTIQKLANYIKRKIN